MTNDETRRRREFPICARKIYLAHAADAPLPRRVAEAMHASVENASQNEKLFDESVAFIAETRATLADFIGAETEKISLTGPTSSGLSAIAAGLDWHGGDEVVCYLDEYPANVYPWLALQRHGVRIIFLEAPKLGEITPEIIERALTKKTKLVALASANYCSGYRIDVDAIGALCHSRGVLFCVDAIQTLGAFPISLAHVDFLSAGAQKWLLGPSGAGFLFVKNRDLLWPNLIGGWNVKSPNFIAQSEIEFAEGGQKFEPGAYSYVAIAGMRAAVDLLAEVGIETLAHGFLRLLLRCEIDYLVSNFSVPLTKSIAPASSLSVIRELRPKHCRKCSLKMMSSFPCDATGMIGRGCESARISTTRKLKSIAWRNC